jgi:hypothetical protein
MQYQLNNIINNLTETFEGTPWHGLSLKVILEEVDVKMAFFRPFPHKHNIAELVAHILIWRQFVIEMLDGNYNFKLDIGALEDFPKVGESEKIWNELLTQLFENQLLLVDKLDTFDPKKLDDEIPKKTFTYRYIFEGVVNHDVYHGGQIALIKAAFQTPQDDIEKLKKTLDFKVISKRNTDEN